MFLVNKLQKMKHNTPLGSRIALVHNGSALFTGDAGQGESNIRRWVLENDWLEAIIALPLNIFYNTGIATYIWVLANKKAEARRGKVQLIDASQWFQPLRRNLGKKNCELSDADIARILDLYLGDAKESTESKWFDTQNFGYWKISVERPLRLKSQLSDERIESLRFATGDEALRANIYATHGEALYTEFAKRKPAIEACSERGNREAHRLAQAAGQRQLLRVHSHTQEQDAGVVRGEDLGRRQSAVPLAGGTDLYHQAGYSGKVHPRRGRELHHLRQLLPSGQDGGGRPGIRQGEGAEENPPLCRIT